MTFHLPNASDLELAIDRVSNTVVMVSAETAKRWLEQNKKNRNISQAVVAKYLGDMKAGLWSFAADPIRFDIDGNLLDGQHRLTALSEADTSIPMLVVRGLHPDSQLVMDQGRKRNAGQQLELHGIKNAKHVAAAVKFLITWERGYLFRDSKVSQTITAPVILDYVESHESDMEFIQANLSRICQVDVPPSVAAAFFIVVNRVDSHAALDFLNQMYSMVGMSEGHPILTLDRRLRKIRRDGIKTPHRDYLAFLILAWNAWRDGRRMTKFQRPVGGSWSADNFPVVK